MAYQTISSRKHLKQVISTLLLASTLCGCSSKAAVGNNSPTPVSVRIIRVQECVNSQMLMISGQAEPFRRTTPASRLMARVNKITFKEGDRVAAGTVLISLDTRDLSARQQQANAAINTASTTYATSQRNLARMRSLMENGTISRTQYENMQVTHAQALASLSTAQAAQRELNVNLSDATIKAPFDGVIVRKMVELGDTVSPGQPMFIIEDDSKLKIEATVATDLTDSLRPGQAVNVRLNNQQFKGVIESLTPPGVPGVAGLRMQVMIENQTHNLRSGSLATIALPNGSNQNDSGIHVPTSALVKYGQLNGVFVVGPENRSRLHWLVLGEQVGDMVSVLAGLASDDRVIINPQGVTDGQFVKEIAR